jgi:hypothetical protein
MSTFKKHVGRIKNTDRRCVVVYMQIPGNEQNALIVDTDALPDRFHDALMDIVDSTEGQQTPHLHTLLSRRILPDLGLDVMNALHTYGLLRAVGIDEIVMYPAPNAPCPLRTIVDFMNGEEAPKEAEVQLENRILENQKSETVQAQVDIAQNIIRQAEDLEAEASRKREQAYRMVPELRPQVTDSPEVIEASVTALEAPVAPVEQVEVTEAVQLNVAENSQPEVVVEAIDPTLPDDVKAALAAAQASFVPVIEEGDVEGNQVDTSDSAIQEFLDRAALREDKEDKEKWAAMQPKNPVGRPRKDGQPAGNKDALVATPQAPKRRGRPPKAKK